MLESATVRRPGVIDNNHDVGRILDAMLYYDRVHVFMDADLLISLLNKCGLQGATDILAHESVTASTTPEFMGVAQMEKNGVLTHRPYYWQLYGTEARKLEHDDVVGIFHEFITRQEQWSGLSRKEVQRLLNPAKPQWLSKSANMPIFDLFMSLALDELTLKMFLQQWAKSIGKHVSSDDLDSLAISPMRVEDVIMIASSPSLDQILKARPWDNFDWGGVLARLLDYTMDLFLSQNYSADLVCAPEVSEVADRRLDLSLQRGARSEEKLRAFEEMVFEKAHYFGGAFTEGKISLIEALNLIDRSRRMRTWIRGLPPDASIIQAYHDEIARETIIDKLPGSTARFAFFASAGAGIDVLGAGGVGTTSALALSAMDAFVVDRVAHGWRPNVFVKNIKKIVGSRG